MTYFTFSIFAFFVHKIWYWNLYFFIPNRKRISIQYFKWYTMSFHRANIKEFGLLIKESTRSKNEWHDFQVSIHFFLAQKNYKCQRLNSSDVFFTAFLFFFFPFIWKLLWWCWCALWYQNRNLFSVLIIRSCTLFSMLKIKAPFSPAVINEFKCSEQLQIDYSIE